MKDHETKMHHKYFIDMLNLTAEKGKDERIEALLMVIANALSVIADILENRL